MTLTEARQQTATRVIEALAGPGATLRGDQLAAIEGLLEPAARVLVVQATGWGKSAVYWVATAIRRSEGAGPTLVVSPLLSLMRDQVGAAARAGLNAATLNSSNISDWSAIENDLRDGVIDVLLVSPERLANPGFGRRVLDALAGNLGMLVIDEAHAVSDWGHDFRPDYRRVADTVRALNPDTPVLATTATANQRVTDDVSGQLGANTLTFRGPLARSSLQLAVIDSLTPLQRYAWVVENLPKLPGSGIVYALTVADAHRLADAINEQHGAVRPIVAAYTGQLDGAERERLEEALRGNELKALVATSALGMGYDKPDLGFCVHVGSPPSPVAYYQQVGRAGRGIDHAVVMLLTSPADVGVWDYFATASIPEPRSMEKLLAVTPVSPAEPASVPALEAESGLRRTKVELMLKQLAVDDIVERTESGWVRTGKQWHYDAEHYDGVVAVREREADIMRDYSRGRRCLMQLLQEALDDPTAAPCGRCSVCIGQLPDGLPSEPAIDVTRAVAGVLRTQSHLVEPRKMWPGGAFGSRGRIPANEQAAVGRALIHADAPEWRELVQQVFGGSDTDAEPPKELVDGLVAVLSSWRRDWASRPEVVIGLPAAGFRNLTDALVARIAEIGRMETAGLTVNGPVSRDLSSPEEAAAWAKNIVVSDPGAIAGKVVLLLVDATGSLWPVTIAASMLRSNGAAAVLPLVVHRRVG
ncbi:RecQ family ATP-dependent DNA helicase [Nakamurella lactea]|uniref:RecQ family ATP-dependent DNA helicase n=1 Tax=Nakamurella lactea TaxID=459515 RepID=UPI0005679A75|nr:DEAD/DEAH box helicase [Nakamurella lactea]